MSMTVMGLSYLAGLLSTLSPCVLPILPIVLGAAASEHKMGPVALAAGLATSFVAIGLFIATIGFSIGLDGSVLRYAAAIILILLGTVMLVPSLSMQIATSAGPFGNWVEERFGGFSTLGLGGQFGVGLLLGAVWSPCVGPTLGAASVLAAQGKDLGQVAGTMLIFGLGAATPLMVLGLLSREALMRWRNRMLGAGSAVKGAFGAFLVVAGLLIISGLDKRFETMLVQASPAWLTELTTRY